MHYGYIGPGTNSRLFVQKKGRYVTGFSVGILYLDENSYRLFPAMSQIIQPTLFPFIIHWFPAVRVSVY